MPEILRAGMGEMKIAVNGGILAAYGIGSCVIVLIYDRARPVAGMLHAMLPAKIKKQDSNKFVDNGIDNLVKGLIKQGVSISDMEAKLFGGARMFDIVSGTEPIGERNIKKAREVLAEKNIAIAAEDTGDSYGRSIEYDVALRRAVVKSFLKGEKVI